MSAPRKVQVYHYVNRSYEDVANLLRSRALPLMQQATTSASARGASLAASLRVGVGGIELATEVKLTVRKASEGVAQPASRPAVIVDLAWEALHNPGLFPTMLAQVEASPLTPTETQLEIRGEYSPPLGMLGAAIDAAVGHRIAEASVHHFLMDIVAQIQRELPDASAAAQ